MTTEAPPTSEKQHALEAITLMPEGATYRQIRDELAMLEAIREGEADADAGRVISHEEMIRRSAEWISR